MKEYLFIYRNDLSALPNVTKEEAQAATKKWMDWMGSIAAQNKLSNRGNRLTNSGRVLRANNKVTDGPYSEIKESIGGFSIVKVDSYEEAVELAKGCPVFSFGGNVEIREVDQL